MGGIGDHRGRMWIQISGTSDQRGETKGSEGLR